MLRDPSLDAVPVVLEVDDLLGDSADLKELPAVAREALLAG
jgi:hypothetical protein